MRVCFLYVLWSVKLKLEQNLRSTVALFEQDCVNSVWTWMRDWGMNYYLLRENASKKTEAISLSSILKGSEEPLKSTDFITGGGEIQSHLSLERLKWTMFPPRCPFRPLFIHSSDIDPMPFVAGTVLGSGQNTAFGSSGFLLQQEGR